MKTVQYFSADYLKASSQMSTQEILQSLESFRLLHADASSRNKLISIKVPEDLLKAFKTKANAMGIPYQSQIKKLMREWLG